MLTMMAAYSTVIQKYQMQKNTAGCAVLEIEERPRVRVLHPQAAEARRSLRTAQPVCVDVVGSVGMRQDCLGAHNEGGVHYERDARVWVQAEHTEAMA